MRRFGGRPNCVLSISLSANELCPPACVERRCTDLEDIGDGDGVLGGLALGGNDGDGRPRHDGYRGRCCLVSRRNVEVANVGGQFSLGELWVLTNRNSWQSSLVRREESRATPCIIKSRHLREHYLNCQDRLEAKLEVFFHLIPTNYHINSCSTIYDLFSCAVMSTCQLCQG